MLLSLLDVMTPKKVENKNEYQKQEKEWKSLRIQTVAMKMTDSNIFFLSFIWDQVRVFFFIWFINYPSFCHYIIQPSFIALMFLFFFVLFLGWK